MAYIGNPPADRYSSVSYQDLTGGTGTSFTLDYAVGSANEIEVFVNNVRQEPSVAYTVAGTALTMTGTIASTDDFYVVFQGKAIASGQIPEKQSNGDYNFDSGALFLDASANSLGIGTTSPSTSHKLTLDHTSNYGGISLKQSGTQVGQIIQEGGTGNVYVDADSGSLGGSLILRTGGTERARVTSNGITFNGDTAAANALDDYEEGTWTPTVGNGTINASYASYTKIGNTVYLRASINNFSDRSTASNIVIGGLPYTSASNSKTSQGILGRYINSGGDAIVAYLGESSSQLFLFTTNQSSDYALVNHNHLSSNSSNFFITISYIA